LKDVLDGVKLTNGRLLGISTDDSSSKYSMTHKRQSSLEASGIKCPALRNHNPCVAHVIQLAVGAVMRCLGDKGGTKSWEAHERNQPLRGNKHMDIVESQRLRKESNARINKVSAM
jgi:hypothetical protein